MTDNTVKVNKPIEGLVAGIITERTLAINVGRNHRVEREMKFKIMAEQPTEITDPQTGESLGSITREKVRVRVAAVSEKFSVCKTYKTYRVGGAGFSGISSLFDPPRRVTETLKAEDSDYLPDLPEEESFVKKGDWAVQVFEDD